MRAYMNNLPLIANLELTNRCNIACKFCAHKFMKRAPADMDREMIDICMKRIDEAGVRQVTLNTIGETLIASQLKYALAQADKRGLLTLISTNGMALNEKNAKYILDNHCSVMRFSVNSIDKNEYESLHCGASFDGLLKNMRMFRKLRDSCGAATQIRVRMVFPSAAARVEQDRLRGFWTKYADETEFVVFGNMGGRNGAAPLDEGERTGCRTMKRGINITADGHVTYCPCDFDAQCIVGNVVNSSLREIWEGERFTKIRLAHDKCDFKNLPQCDYCDATRTSWYEKKIPVLSEKEQKIMDSFMMGWRGNK